MKKIIEFFKGLFGKLLNVKKLENDSNKKKVIRNSQIKKKKKK
jgi:hypothetical protein